MKLTKNHRCLLDLLDHASDHFARRLEAQPECLPTPEEMPGWVESIFEEECILDAVKRVDFGDIKLSEIKDYLGEVLSTGILRHRLEKKLSEFITRLPKSKEDRIKEIKVSINSNGALIEELMKQYRDETGG